MDHAATTPMDPRVKKAMEPFWSDKFGNPNAIYKEGREARTAVSKARAGIAKFIGARPEEIIFTSGGTESDNLAILGISGGAKQNFSRFAHLEARLPSGSRASKLGIRPHIITTKFEHPAVLEPCKFLEKNGFDVTYLNVGKEGVVDPEDVKKALRPETILVSIIYANNEIGTIQPIKEIAKVIRDFKKGGSGKLTSFFPLFHSDACQAPGYLELDVNKLGVDFMTINGSKIYGPKGVGILYAKKGIKLQPIMRGGEQERKIRPGTENVAAIVGLAEALKIAHKERAGEAKRLTTLRDYFIGRITTEIPKTFLNGHSTERLPNNINVSILDVEGESILLYLDEKGIACSTGSACTSEDLKPSHVIMALGRPYAYAHGALRFSLGKSNTKKDIDYVMNVLPRIVEKLKRISPVNVKVK